MLLRRFFVLAISLTVLFPLAAHAQLDQRCFTKKACEDIRRELAGSLRANDGIGGGFVSNSETASVCGGKDSDGTDLGFCLPVGTTKTATSFGGRDTFSDMADFIQYGYRFAIIIAGLLAVLITIISGFQWMASGGNSDTIHSAQERIKNAVIGLSLAVLSYTILNQVNPYLVHLRLPQVWLVNKQGTVPGYCNSVQSGVKLAFNKIVGAEQSAQEKEAKLQDATASTTGNFIYKRNTAECGKEYFTKDGGLQTCRGTACPATPGGVGQVCLPTLEDQALVSCRAGQIGGVIYNSSPTAAAASGSTVGGAFTEDWAWTWVDSVELYRVCDNGDFDSVAKGKIIQEFEKDKTQLYTIIIDTPQILIGDATEDCQKNKKSDLKGFVIYADMNESTADLTDEPHMLGKSGTTAVDLGDKNEASPLIFTGIGEGAFKKTAQTAPKAYFLRPSDILEGIMLNIDAGAITDIDDPSDRNVYRQYGY